MRKLATFAVALAAAVLGLSTTVAAQSSNDGSPSSPAVTPSAIPPTATTSVAVDGTLYFSIDDNGLLYRIDVNTAQPTLVGNTGVTSNTVGLAPTADPSKLVGSTWQDITVINADGSGFNAASDNLMQAEGLAYDSAHGVLYKIINNQFSVADQTTGATVTTLTPPGEDLEGIDWRGTDGKVYGFGADSDQLFAYTPGTDSWAVVGHTGIPPEVGAGLAWDPGNDVLFGISGSGILYRIDPTTAATVEIGDTGLGAGGGLAFIGMSGTLVVGDVLGSAGADVHVPVSGTCGTTAGNNVSVTAEDAGRTVGAGVSGTTTAGGAWTAELVVHDAVVGDYTVTGTCSAPGGASVALPPGSFTVAALVLEIRLTG
ncbi:MAG TPA: hypothetical protein VH986_15070 [Acidimicrobiia bacterium]